MKDSASYIWLVGWLVTLCVLSRSLVALCVLSRGLVALCVLHRGSMRKFWWKQSFPLLCSQTTMSLTEMQLIPYSTVNVAWASQRLPIRMFNVVLADNGEWGMLLTAGRNVTHTHRKVADQGNQMCASAVHVAFCLYENTSPLLYYFLDACGVPYAYFKPQRVPLPNEFRKYFLGKYC